MNVSTDNAYGYKVCYTKRRFKKKYIDIFHVRSFKRAMQIKREFVNNRNSGKKKLSWYVIPITRKEVKNGIWKKPF